MEQQFNLQGMTCNGCKASVEEKLSAIKQVTRVEANLVKATVTLQSAKKLSVGVLQKALPEKYIVSKIEEELVSKVNLDINNGKSTLQQLYPLFLIFVFITVASVLLSINPWSFSDFMFDFMGLFYIVFSFFKLLDVKGFSNSFRMYDPLAKKVKVYGLVYPFIELVLGVLFLIRFQTTFALVVTIVILGITTIGVIKSLLSKQTIKCACLGSVLNLPMTKATFIENSIMIIMAIIMLVEVF
jgi:copper chaperone CopZ